MSKQDRLEQYKKDVTNLRNCAKKLDLTDGEIAKIFQECFKQLNQEILHKNLSQETQAQKRNIFTTTKVFIFIIILAILLYILLNVHQPTSSIVLRNVQGLIYPGLKLLRFFSVPIIKQFPKLTDLYYESCLVENPYFYVSDMECWPCESVHSVIDLTGYDNHSLYQSGVPYIVHVKQGTVNFENLKQNYLENQDSFDKEADSIKSSNISLKSLQDLFKNNEEFSPETHITWRINKMLPARLIRSLFPRPYIISERAGQSVERFIMVDGPKAAGYYLPNTECSYIFLIQGSGDRTIILRPSKECGTNCRTISVILKQSYVLWYNWWYWRPISLPSDNATNESVTYIGSYC